jgi:hypothetical protein
VNVTPPLSVSLSRRRAMVGELTPFQLRPGQRRREQHGRPSRSIAFRRGGRRRARRSVSGAREHDWKPLDPDKVTRAFVVTDDGERVEIPLAEVNAPTHQCRLCGIVAVPR